MVGKRLRQLRTQQGLSLRALAQKSGLSRSFICDVEHGKCGLSVASLRVLARVLGVDEGVFFERGSDRTS
ncbi:helix-turn-helix transcriptional regulator [Gelria sp. Kuro-4]|uniref:helix-turn-helix domain-containing protein n=1 Tax=Gelria sp. Kuro-4 TaxID=2796927 RepID=UPI001C7FD308